MQDFPPPSTEERARLRQEHAHRFPETATLRLPGDRGVPVFVHTVIANPSGACDMPAGAKVIPAWSFLLRSAMSLAREPGDIAALLATDCLLYPDATTWASVRKRWPEVNRALAEEIQRKIGMSNGTRSEPFAGDLVPDAIEQALGADPTRAWYYFQPRQGVRYAAAIQPQSAAQARVQDQALAKAGADPWAIVKGAALKSMVAAVREQDGKWEPVDAADIIARFPGVAIFVVGALSRLSGAAAEAELGEL